MFIALGGSRRLLLPASVFASKTNPESRDLASRTLQNTAFARVFPDDKSAILCVNEGTEKGKRNKNKKMPSEGVRGLRAPSLPSVV